MPHIPIERTTFAFEWRHYGNIGPWIHHCMLAEKEVGQLQVHPGKPAMMEGRMWWDTRPPTVKEEAVHERYSFSMAEYEPGNVYTKGRVEWSLEATTLEEAKVEVKGLLHAYAASKMAEVNGA